ncbi:hypothetical protein BDW62DRAFT_189743 [Aspergillus aurantiobrunneus]
MMLASRLSTSCDNGSSHLQYSMITAAPLRPPSSRTRRPSSSLYTMDDRNVFPAPGIPGQKILVFFPSRHWRKSSRSRNHLQVPWWCSFQIILCFVMKLRGEIQSMSSFKRASSTAFFTVCPSR